MSHRQTLTTYIPERTTRTFATTFLNESGVGVEPATILLTLYDERTKTVLNARTNQNVKNLNGGTVTSGGVFTLDLVVADTAIVTAGRQLESHVALLQWTWGASKADKAEIAHTIENLALMP